MADVSANSLQRRANTAIVRQTISDIYKSINLKIAEASNKNQSEIYYDLQDVFNFDGIEPADAQLIVYSQLIEKFTEKGDHLDVRLIRTPTGNSRLRIKWTPVLDPVERERMKKIIIKHLEVEK